MHTAITNKDFQEILRNYPNDAIISIEYCNPRIIEYDKVNKIIKIN